MALEPRFGYIANTDPDWFDFPERKGRWDEVTFWNPSDYYAFRGAPASPFLFRLKAPRNMIGGFGLVSGFARLPEWLAWECYGGEDGPHAVSNGLLLRSDLHRLFDRGHLTVTPDYRLEVSRQLQEHFQNGKSYYPLHGTQVVVPRSLSHRPDQTLLRWHNENKFLSQGQDTCAGLQCLRGREC